MKKVSMPTINLSVISSYADDVFSKVPNGYLFKRVGEWPIYLKIDNKQVMIIGSTDNQDYLPRVDCRDFTVHEYEVYNRIEWISDKPLNIRA